MWKNLWLTWGFPSIGSDHMVVLASCCCSGVGAHSEDLNLHKNRQHLVDKAVYKASNACRSKALGIRNCLNLDQTQIITRRYYCKCHAMHEHVYTYRAVLTGSNGLSGGGFESRGGDRAEVRAEPGQGDHNGV